MTSRFLTEPELAVGASIDPAKALEGTHIP